MIDAREMSPEKLAEYGAWARLHYGMTHAARHLRSLEEEFPGFLAATASLQERMEGLIWEATGVTSALLERGEGDVWRLVASPRPGDGPISIVIGAGAPARATTGHCPDGYLCDQCRWDSMSPAERAEVDRKEKESAEQRRRRRGSTGGGAQRPPGSARAELADWERDLGAVSS